jgi:Flp pilus assembly protein TadD
MRRWMLTIMLSVSLALGVWPSWAGAADKAQEATERAARDYLKYGLLQAGEGRDEAAAKGFREALKLRPNWAEVHSLLGSTLARLGQYREAEAELRKAVALKPDYAEGYYYLGLFLKERGRDKEAQEAFDQAKKYQK